MSNCTKSTWAKIWPCNPKHTAFARHQLSSHFAGPHLSDERQPQEEADHGDGQNQQLPAVRPAQLLGEQVDDDRGQVVHVDKLRMQKVKGQHRLVAPQARHTHARAIAVDVGLRLGIPDCLWSSTIT